MAEQPAKKEKVVQLNVRLAPVNNSDQPVFANYSTVGVAQATAYLDFGFIEPARVVAVAKRAADGGGASQPLDGKLVVRVALGLDALVRLQQQVQQVLGNIRKGNAPA